MTPTLLVAWRVLTERYRRGDATGVLSSALRAVLGIRDLVGNVELRTRVHIREERRNPILPREHHAPIPCPGHSSWPRSVRTDRLTAGGHGGAATVVRIVLCRW